MNQEPKQELSTRHQAIMMAFVFEGLSVKDAAIRFDITEGRLKILKNSPLWKMEEKKLSEELLQENKTLLLAKQAKALGVLEDCMEREREVVFINSNGEKDTKIQAIPPDVRLRAANSVLDRTGLGVSNTVSIEAKIAPTDIFKELESIREHKKQLMAEMNIFEGEVVG